ncbi:hypothetical protein GY45DRAFT_1320539 [Cubamyces sp. BRFM 1775]|nr:hypothetical protein GY45DRAFT_1320539 [Cubamyces sp. BRFM 1775]
MSFPLYWPGKYHFYPIGNTSAVSLTRDLPASVPGNILLLPCGDPRNVLFTVYCEPPSTTRKLDFTCVDFDAGLLARNVLLLAMIMDDVPQPFIWDIFFDMYLNDKSVSALVVQCRKLVACSGSMQDWLSSPYSSVLRFATAYTVAELRRVWTFYIDHTPPAASERTLALRAQIEEGRNAIRSEHHGVGLVSSSARSSGPLYPQAVSLYSENFEHYWKTGATSYDKQVLNTLSHANPTFLFSRLGEGFRVHYGTDPMTPFHLVALFGNYSSTRPTAPQMVLAAQTEFREWCDAFRAQAASPQSVLAVRFLLGDALHVARAFDTWTRHGPLQTTYQTPITVWPWTVDLLELSVEEYTIHKAPTLFDVVDTSNLSDHVGYLNIFLATIPLLSFATPWSGVLYTESLVAQRSDATTQFSSMLPAELTTIALTLGICPVDALSGFATICNTHELVLEMLNAGSNANRRQQFHQVLTWRRPYTGDPEAQLLVGSHPSLNFDPLDLASCLFDAYVRLFGSDDAYRFWKTTHEDLPASIARSALSTYSRETFVLFLRLIRARGCAGYSEDQWSKVIELLLQRICKAATCSELPFESPYHQDLSAQLHRYRVYTYPVYHEKLQALPERLSMWTSVPPLVRIYLEVPYKKFAVLHNTLKQMPTPTLQCVVHSTATYENGFQSVDATFGTIMETGTARSPSVSIRAADGGLNATRSPLVVSFVVPTWTLTGKGTSDPDNIMHMVDLCVKSSPASARVYLRTLGSRLAIFSARLSDLQHVHVVPEERLPPVMPSPVVSETEPHTPSTQQNGCPWKQTSLRAEMDSSRNIVLSLTAKLGLEDLALKKVLAEGAFPTVSQSSPFTMRVSLGEHTIALFYPLPVVGDKQKTRLARKSSYIEVVVPIAMPYPDVWAMRFNPFPVVREKTMIFAWNMHHVPLDRLPVVDIRSATHAKLEWIGPHVGAQLSQRERRMREQETSDILGLVKDTIHAIIVHVTGLQTGRPRNLFALYDATTKQADTFLFISDLRYDIASHTVVCDGYVLTLCMSLASAIHSPMSKVTDIVSVNVYGEELRAWKQLLPGLVERCRSMWEHGENCEYIAQGRIPLSLEINAGDPLCSCGRGKDVRGMERVKAWKDLAPFVTRIALSPIFAVSYLEPVFDVKMFESALDTEPQTPSSGANASNREATGAIASAPERCRKCSKASGDLLRCSGCKSVSYCSRACQRGDWREHRATCLLRSGTNT